MSAVIPAVVFEMHVARSAFIDAYNCADIAMRARLRKLGIADKQLASQNIEALTKVAPNPQYSKAEKARIDGLLTKLRELQSVRCDVVHSRMQTMPIDGLPHAMFANVQSVVPIGRRGLFLTKLDMEQGAAELVAIAEALTPQVT